MEKTSVTIKDIAKAAGVYPSVVSNALNNKSHTRISKTRRQYIRDVAEKMGYRPNFQAACLRRKKKPTIGVFLPDWRDLLLYELVAGLSESSNNYDIPLSVHFGLTLEAYSHFINAMTEHRHLGLISYVPFLTKDYSKIIDKLKYYQNDGGRIILVNPYNDELSCCMVAKIDEARGGFLAAEYLGAQPCSRYAVIGFDNLICRARAESFTRELSKTGKETEVIQIPSTANFNVAELISHVDRLTSENESPVGIFSATSAFCSYIVARCLEQGIEIGNQVKIVGYDHVPRYGEYAPIPRIIQPFRELGRLVVAKMESILNGNHEDTLQLEPELSLTTDGAIFQGDNFYNGKVLVSKS